MWFTTKHLMRYRIMHGHQWGYSPHWRIAPRIPTKSLFIVSYTLIYFFHVILCSRHTNPMKTLIDGPFPRFRQCHQGRPGIMTSPLNNVGWSSLASHKRAVLGIVKSYSTSVLARANWCNIYIHLWITTVNIDVPLLGFHGVICKMYLIKLIIS